LRGRPVGDAARARLPESFSEAIGTHLAKESRYSPRCRAVVQRPGHGSDFAGRWSILNCRTEGYVGQVGLRIGLKHHANRFCRFSGKEYSFLGASAYQRPRPVGLASEAALHWCPLLAPRFWLLAPSPLTPRLGFLYFSRYGPSSRFQSP